MVFKAALYEDPQHTPPYREQSSVRTGNNFYSRFVQSKLTLVFRRIRLPLWFLFSTMLDYRWKRRTYALFHPHLKQEKEKCCRCFGRNRSKH